MPCTFCDLVARRAPVSTIHEDDTLMAFMALKPVIPGECLVIPKAHVDHFTDLDDGTAQRIIVLAQRIGRRMRTVLRPERVGMLVHGFGVPHAHLILVPQQGPDDLTSGRLARMEGDRIVFRNDSPAVDRASLDAQAHQLAEG
jgi:histidine triad (HIT) family protein